MAITIALSIKKYFYQFLDVRSIFANWSISNAASGYRQSACDSVLFEFEA